MSQKIGSKVLKTAEIEWRNLCFLQDEDFKVWNAGGDKKLMSSLLRYQFVDPFKVWEQDGRLYCLDGKHRYLDLIALEKAGNEIPSMLPATFIDCANETEAAELVLVYSSAYAQITQSGLDAYLQKFDLSFPELDSFLSLPITPLEEFAEQPEDKVNVEQVKTALADRFLIPPFSILDTRQGYWQDRKRLWQGLGFNSQETREDVEIMAKSAQSPSVYALKNEMRERKGSEPSWDEVIEEAKKRGMRIYEGASIFDPVLTEICYRWFNVQGGTIIDPFAGGSVRGIVAAALEYPYIGIDLRDDQVQSNIKQAASLQYTNAQWITGDSNVVLDSMTEQADFIFSCPPYHDLEVYSEDPADLSNMEYDDFLSVYRSTIGKAASKLKENRFACFVVGDVRDKQGFYRDFVGDTVQAFKDAGMDYYNEIVLINVVGSLAIRVGRQFDSGRKVGKMHQNVLVFFKGNPKKIREEFPELKLGDCLDDLNINPNIAL